jgi:hypothetical protein
MFTGTPAVHIEMEKMREFAAHAAAGCTESGKGLPCMCIFMEGEIYISVPVTLMFILLVYGTCCS